MLNRYMERLRHSLATWLVGDLKRDLRRAEIRQAFFDVEHAKDRRDWWTWYRRMDGRVDGLDKSMKIVALSHACRALEEAERERSEQEKGSMPSL